MWPMARGANQDGLYLSGKRGAQLGHEKMPAPEAQ
jgi:hypothetical protein